MKTSKSGTDTLIAIAKPSARVVVRFRGHTIADTQNALTIEEAGHEPVFYIPRRDIDLSWLVQSKTVTFCSRKGRATHYSLELEGQQSIDAAWAYEYPLPAVDAIADHIAFYENRVDELRIDLPNTI